MKAKRGENALEAASTVFLPTSTLKTYIFANISKKSYFREVHNNIPNWFQIK